MEDGVWPWAKQDTPVNERISQVRTKANKVVIADFSHKTPKKKLDAMTRCKVDGIQRKKQQLKAADREAKKAASEDAKRWDFVRVRLNKLRQEFGNEFGKGGCEYYIFNSLKPF